jgi:hypothetical protein
MLKKLNFWNIIDFVFGWTSRLAKCKQVSREIVLS